eukprot:scaffold263333_cov19-Prasinocladus_malaysianus.AAC.1
MTSACHATDGPFWYTTSSVSQPRHSWHTSTLHDELPIDVDARWKRKLEASKLPSFCCLYVALASQFNGSYTLYGLFCHRLSGRQRNIIDSAV